MDVGVFSNPIQGLCQLNGLSKLSPTPPPQPRAFPMELGDNSPMTSSKKTCTPGSQGQDLFLSSLVPIAGWRSGTQLLGLLETQCIREWWDSGCWVLLRYIPGLQPPSFSYCGRRGLENRLPKPQRKG